MKKTNLSWVGALLVFALLLWCTAATPGTIADPASYAPAVYSSMLSLLPPVVAIVLALNTKEVYTSLLVGIATGALLFANGNLELAVTTLFFNEDGGMVAKLSDSSNMGILVFLVMLGILVALMNKAGGSAAFGRWASTHIHTRAGAQFATLILGVLIFVDDYFNCLTVGSVMRPVTDRQKVSRAKLAYLIDSTAAPVCIIAPVSSWAAAVTSSVPEGSGINGFTMFLRTIPYNYYAVMTVVMSLFLIFTGTDFGSMKLNEDNAKNGDLFTTADRPYGNDVDDGTDTCGHVADLLAPVLVLIVACIFGMIYTGGFFEGVDFITAFSDCNASAGLVLGSSIALMFTFVLPLMRNLLPGWHLHWYANAITGLLTVLLIAPFLRAIVMKKNHSAEWKRLWVESSINRVPLLFTVFVRFVIALAFIFYIINFLSRFTNALMVCIGAVIVLLMLGSRRIKKRSIVMERLFLHNLRSRDIAAQVNGEKRPLYEGHLLDRDIHISEIEVPEDSIWCGKSLKELHLRQRFGIDMSSIRRGSQRLNIPNGDTMIFPGDKLQIIGNDDQVHKFAQALTTELAPEDLEIEKREMKLRQLIISGGSEFLGKTLEESGIRNKYNCMVVGLEEGQENLTHILPSRVFEKGDIIWLVGEEADLQKIQEKS